MAGANVLVPSVESSTRKSAPFVHCYYCNLCEKYAKALIVLLSARNTHALEHLYQTSLSHIHFVICMCFQFRLG